MSGGALAVVSTEEPIFQSGPFVMASKGDLSQAFADSHAGTLMDGAVQDITDDRILRSGGPRPSAHEL